MRETWTFRDLPVLIAAAEHLDETMGDPIESWRLARQIETPTEDVERALRVLIPTYLEGAAEASVGGPGESYVTGITEDGLRAAGQWPDRADHLAALLAAVTQAVDDMEDEEERTKLQKLWDALNGAPKRVTEAVVAGVVAGQIGGI